MANKALAKRQKMTMRTEPSQKAARSSATMPAAASAKQRGDSRRGETMQAPLLQRLLSRKSSA
jgi:hypothetical protein